MTGKVRGWAIGDRWVPPAHLGLRKCAWRLDGECIHGFYVLGCGEPAVFGIHREAPRRWMVTHLPSGLLLLERGALATAANWCRNAYRPAAAPQWQARSIEALAAFLRGELSITARVRLEGLV